MTVRFYLDSEFIEDGRTIDLISLAVVAEDGREFYAELPDHEIPWDRANSWVLENVRPKLGGVAPMPRVELRRELVQFVADGGPDPEMWADYGAYDWVVVCQLFGSMADLPAGWPMYCNDLQQLIRHKHLIPATDPQSISWQHNALSDARGVAYAVEWLLKGQ